MPLPKEATTSPSAPSAPPRDWFWGGHALAMFVLFLISVWIFRDHILGRRIFIGNSDRLNFMINVIRYEIKSLHAGRLDAWSDQMFCGFNTLGLPHIFPQPLMLLESLAPDSSLLYVTGLMACLLLSGAGWAAYGFIRSVTQHSGVSFVGACLYQCCALTTLKVSQNEMSFAVIIVIPLMLLVLRSIQPGRELRNFVLLSILLSYMLTCMFLQKAAYAMILVGSYTVYRSIRMRDFRPLLVFGLACVVGGLFSFPRIVTVGEDIQQLRRESPGIRTDDFEDIATFQNIHATDILRLFNDGILGRYPEEGFKNGVNLTEGVLLYTSDFTCFVLIFGGLLLAFQKGRTFLFHDDTPFFLAVVLFGVAVITVKPVLYVLFIAFMRMDFTHARVLIIALLPLCTLVALILKQLMHADYQHGEGRIVIGSLAGATALLGLMRVLVEFTAHDLWKLPGFFGIEAWSPDSMDRELPFEMAILRSLGFVALGIGLTLGVSVWRRRREALHTSVFWTRLRALALVLPGLGLFTLQALSESRGDWLLLFPAELPEPAVYLRGPIFLRVEWALLITGLLLFLIHQDGGASRRALFLTHVLGFLLVLNAVGSADRRINARCNYGDKIPFQGGNLFVAPPQQFSVPSSEARSAFRARLETEAYRSTFVVDRAELPIYCSSYMCQIWDWRLLDGHISGVPKGLRDLPWPPNDAVGLRTIQFSSKTDLPWDLLAFCNVKYAVVLNQGIYRNYVVENDAVREAKPDDVEIIVNPRKPLPRHFLTASIKPVVNATESVRGILASEDLAGVLAQSCFVDRDVAEKNYDASGPLQVVYDGDTVDITVAPSDRPRFVVLNELYHPRWHAYHEGKRLDLLRANIYMRGVEIPARAEHVTLRFEPFAKTAAAGWFMMSSVVVFFGGIFLLKRFSRQKTSVAAESRVGDLSTKPGGVTAMLAVQ